MAQPHGELLQQAGQAGTDGEEQVGAGIPYSGVARGDQPLASDLALEMEP